MYEQNVLPEILSDANLRLYVPVHRSFNLGGFTTMCVCLYVCSLYLERGAIYSQIIPIYFHFSSV